MEIISPGWFVWHAVVGAAIGYALRVLEHAVWSSTQHQKRESTFSFSMVTLPASFVVGGTLGYISLILLAPIIKDETAIGFSAYLLSAFWAFLTLDIRDFLRRH